MKLNTIQIPRIKKKEKLIEKRCMFIDENNKRCSVIFFGTGKSKFCKLHRQPKFRKIIDRDKIMAKKKLIIEKCANFTIAHKYVEPIEVTRSCDCCGLEYSFILYPSTFIYPKYCPDHRNEYKRELYLKRKKEEKEKITN